MIWQILVTAFARYSLLVILSANLTSPLILKKVKLCDNIDKGSVYWWGERPAKAYVHFLKVTGER